MPVHMQNKGLYIDEEPVLSLKFLEETKISEADSGDGDQGVSDSTRAAKIRRKKEKRRKKAQIASGKWAMLRCA